MGGVTGFAGRMLSACQALHTLAGPESRPDWKSLPGLIPVIAGILGLIILIILAVVIKKRGRKHYVSQDGMDFEKYCANILRKCGYRNIEMTRSSGDYGVDIFADRDGITWAFQCKYYDSPVGLSAVQEIYSGREFYHCVAGVVMTNSTFTKAAKNLAEVHNILLWDGDFLERLDSR